MIPGSSVEQILDTTRRTGEVLHNALGTLGLRLNYGPGKTAALVAFTGKGSRKAKAKLLQDGSAQPYIKANTNDGERQIPIAKSYKHLGVRNVATSAMGPELRVRAGCGFTAVRGIKSFLTSSSFKLKTNTAVIKTYVASVVYYAAGG